MATKTKAQLKSAIYAGSENLPSGPAQTTGWYKKAREMRLDPTVALARQLAIAPVLAAEWSFDTKENVPPGAADFISENLKPMRLHILRNTLLGWIDFGWQPFEKVFAFDDVTGNYCLKKLKPLLQDITSILIEPEHGNFIGLEQEDDDVRIDVEYALLLSCDVEGTDWYGNAIMRNAERPYDSWNEIGRAATRYDARIAGSHWVVYYPVGSTPQANGTRIDNYDLARQILSALESSGRVAIPRATDEMLEAAGLAGENSSWKIELISDRGAGATAFIERMKYLDSLKVRAFGLPERSVLEGQFGTKAEAGEHGDFAILNMQLRHNQVCEALNWYVVNQLLRVNYGKEFEGTVYITPAPLADSSIAFLRTLYQTLLASPEGFANEIMNLDLESLKERIGVPILKDGGQQMLDDMLEQNVGG